MDIKTKDKIVFLNNPAEVTHMPDITWAIRGPHFINCNCDYGCPCQFTALPSDGTCRAVVVWRIDEGYFGDVRVDGLIAANTYDWPGAIHQGNGAMQSIIDERADSAQRAALVSILSGEEAEPGSSMLKIYRTMCDTVHEPLYKPMELNIDMERRTGQLNIPDVLHTAIEPLKNPVSGVEHRARIDLPFGKEFNIAEVASGTTKATGAVPLDFAASHAHFVENSMTSSGIES